MNGVDTNLGDNCIAIVRRRFSMPWDPRTAGLGSADEQSHQESSREAQRHGRTRTAICASLHLGGSVVAVLAAFGLIEQWKAPAWLVVVGMTAVGHRCDNYALAKWLGSRG